MPKRKHRGTQNPEYIQAMRDIRRSSASQPHADRRTRRARTKGTIISRALREL